MVRPATRSRIEAGHRFSAFYRNGFANHLPMALVALDAMGADDGAIDRFASHYEAQLEAIGNAAVRIEEGQEAAFLGNAASFPAWIPYFEARIAESGVASVVRDWLARLASGVGAQAFHGVIRLAYAIESGSEREVAHALAYWAAAFESHGDVAISGSESPAEVLAAAARGLAGRRHQGRGVTARTRSAASSPGFADIVARLDPRYLSIDPLAEAMIRAYAASGDFTMLHGVTGAHAFRVLMPLMHDGAEALRHLWTSIVAAYLGAGAPPIDGWNLAGDERLDWPEIHARAAACLDEHDIKLAYSCWREWEARGDELYRRAASARITHAAATLTPTLSQVRGGTPDGAAPHL